MIYPILAGVLIVVALLVAFFAARMLFRGHWLLGWLRGMIGLVLIAAALLLVFMALDLNGYRQLQKEQPVATLSFSRQGDQFFEVTVVEAGGREQKFELMGDLWQLDARLLKWHNRLLGLGLSTGYKLDRISGRYLALEDEQRRPRTVYNLASDNSVVDTWQWLHDYGAALNLVDASYGSATYLPMRDGALFAVTLGNTGLVARPLNARAEEVTAEWQ